MESLSMTNRGSSWDHAPQRCRSCQTDAVAVLLDFGPQPPSNRFETMTERSADAHPLVIGQCSACGLLQLVAPMAPAMVRPRFEWLTYNEPERHLDDLVARLCSLPGLNRDSRIVGLTYKDDTMLQRFNRLGFTNTYRYDVRADLAIDDPKAGLESIQAVMRPATASGLVAQHGKADVLLVRHVLEHAHDPVGFLSVMSMLVRPGGYLLLEIPDCTKFIEACDYSFVWEEHITYFSSSTLAAVAGHANLACKDVFAYPYPFEDHLIGILANQAPTGPSRSETRAPAALLADGAAFSKRYGEVTARLQSSLQNWRRQGKRIAVFGAGHLAVRFINLHGLHAWIDCVIDDHPKKQELLMPGSRLPIRSSAALDGVDICLLALSAESEQKLIAKHGRYLDRGGKFLSIFALGNNSVHNASAA
ncbi:MAG TPA: class I SAM-dependent methyltransferase [Alphaproteobacteria bacterium]|nr:class I SAM-dependent methyltransferase [Alphaproteobacteria bacterium]